jgi:transcriptional regulator with XRE-family HTH domain
MNRSQFQRAIGVAYSTILNWERGRTRPNASHLQLISQVTGVPVSELLGAKDRNEGDRKPPGYPALGQFLASQAGSKLTKGERQTLEGIVFHDIVPSVATFHAIVVGMRMGVGDIATPPRRPHSKGSGSSGKSKTKKRRR